MDITKMVYGIDILDYYRMDLRESRKWLIETRLPLRELDRLVKKMVKRKKNDSDLSAKELAHEMEKRHYFKILEDLTGVISHTMECEVE